MLLVKTHVGKSTIHGLGLFAAEDIPPDTMIWEYSIHIDGLISITDMNLLPEVARNHVKKAGWVYDVDYWVLLGDDARFINHSDNPNTYTTRDLGPVRASRMIRSGEELLEDYKVYGKF